MEWFLSFDVLEDRTVPALVASEIVPLLPPGGLPPPPPVILVGDPAAPANEVQVLLDRAAAATPSSDAIIAVVDRNGRVLGVKVESGVSPALLADPALRSFAVDGALAEARTAAYFANNTAPLTSRTVRFISQ